MEKVNASEDQSGQRLSSDYQHRDADAGSLFGMGDTQERSAPKRRVADLTLPTAEAWSSMDRLQRKRYQEKRRRNEFTEALAKLLSTLLAHDEDFLREAKQRQERLTGRPSSRPKKSRENEDETSLFNRVELINQAIFTIEHLAQLNTQLAKGKNLPPRKPTGFHYGVGPIFAGPHDLPVPSNHTPKDVGMEVKALDIGAQRLAAQGLGVSSNFPYALAGAVPTNPAWLTPVAAQQPSLVHLGTSSPLHQTIQSLQMGLMNPPQLAMMAPQMELARSQQLAQAMSGFPSPPSARTSTGTGGAAENIARLTSYLQTAPQQSQSPSHLPLFRNPIVVNAGSPASGMPDSARNNDGSAAGMPGSTLSSTNLDDEDDEADHEIKEI